MRDGPTQIGGPGGPFPSTRWSRVLAAADPRDPRRRESLDALLRDYWKPVYGSIRRAWGRSNEDAKDLAQEFFCRLLETGFFEGLDPARGSFRAYLKAALRHFLSNVHRDEGRLKRGGGAPGPVAIDAMADFDPPDVRPGESPDQYVDRLWLDALLARGLDALRRDAPSIDFDLFRRCDMADAAHRPSYADLAREFGVSETHVTNVLHRVRRRFREILLSLVAETVGSPADAERELRELLHE